MESGRATRRKERNGKKQREMKKKKGMERNSIEIE